MFAKQKRQLADRPVTEDDAVDRLNREVIPVLRELMTSFREIQALFGSDDDGHVLIQWKGNLVLQLDGAPTSAPDTGGIVFYDAGSLQVWKAGDLLPTVIV